jgi:vacuolar-type H+-ATPase subunit C/Vma6
LLEHLTKESADGIKINQQMVNDLLKEDKEIRLLTYKIIVEKFNSKYNNLSDKQKGVLKEYIGSISDTTNLKAYLNSTLNDIKQELTESVQKITDQVTRIKIQEVVKLIKPIKENQTIKDEMIASILQYYELIEEINQANI